MRSQSSCSKVTPPEQSEGFCLGSVYLREQRSFYLDKLDELEDDQSLQNQTLRLKNKRNQGKTRKPFWLHSPKEAEEAIESKVEINLPPHFDDITDFLMSG